jgi:hypothetical protein
VINQQATLNSPLPATKSRSIVNPAKRTEATLQSESGWEERDDEFPVEPEDEPEIAAPLRQESREELDQSPEPEEEEDGEDEFPPEPGEEPEVIARVRQESSKEEFGCPVEDSRHREDGVKL